MLQYLLASLNREDGQGMAEYALIIALVAVMLILALQALTGGIEGVFSDIVAGFNGG